MFETKSDCETAIKAVNDSTSLAELQEAEGLIKRAVSSLEKRKKRLREMLSLDSVHLEFQCACGDYSAVLASMSAMICEHKKLTAATTKGGSLPCGTEDCCSTSFRFDSILFFFY